jgi:hypothetical protein
MPDNTICGGLPGYHHKMWGIIFCELAPEGHSMRENANFFYLTGF